MNMSDALSTGILALNTHVAPDATSAELYERLDANADEAVKMLSELRNVLELGDELLELHERTGISLDNWTNARQFVELVTGKAVIPNGV